MMWDVVPLRRLFRVVNGGTPTGDEDNWDGSVPWATPVDIGAVDGDYLVATQRSLSEQGVRTGSKTVPCGSLVLSTRAPIGYVAEVRGRTAFNQGCRGLVPTTTLDPRYFRYQMLMLRDELLSRGAGSTFMELSSYSLATTPVILPPIEEQSRIAHFLDGEVDRIAKAIDFQLRLRRLVMERVKAHLDQLVEDLSSRFGATPFRRTMRSIEQGVSPQCENYEADPDSWGVLKVSAVKEGQFVESENKQLPSSAQPMKRYEIRHGDLLITRANTPSLVGDVAVVSEPRAKLMLCDKIFRVTLVDRLLPDFLSLTALSTRIRSICAEASHGTSASMSNLRADEIKRWPIPLAPVATQRSAVDEIAAKRTRALSLTDTIDYSLKLLAERRQALITAAVTGQIDVTTARGVDV